MTPTPLPPVDLIDPAPSVEHQPTAEHFTRLWPSTPGLPSDAPFFLALMSPVRALALGVLWATSSPGRLLIGLAVLAAAVAVLLIAL